MAVLKNRAKMSTSTTGTGTITLGSAEDGYQSFADAGVANADVVRYIIEDTGGAFEIGTGTYTSSGTTLSRTVSESSNSDAAINLSGSATVFIGATAEDILSGASLQTTEALVNGDLVSLNSTGTVSKVSLGGDLSAGSSTTVTTAGNQYVLNSTVATDGNGTFVTLYRADFSYPYVVAHTVSGTTITIGTPVVLRSSAQQDASAIIYDADQQKYLVVCPFSDFSQAFVISVSGTTITASSSTNLPQKGSGWAGDYDASQNKGVFLYRRSSDSDPYVVAATISGTSVSFNTPALVQNIGYALTYELSYNSTAQKSVAFYTDSTGNVAYANAIGLSGSTFTIGSAVTVATGDKGYSFSIHGQSAVGFIYRDRTSGSNLEAKARVGSISGTTITLGTEVTLCAGRSDYNWGFYDSGSEKIIFGFEDSNPPEIRPATLSGTTITLGTATTLSTGVSGYLGEKRISKNASGVFMVQFQSYSPNGIHVIALEVSGPNIDDFIGIAGETIAANATGTINTLSDINTGQSSLTIGSKYYLQADGTLGTTVVVGKEVGIALSATDLLITYDPAATAGGDPDLYRDNASSATDPIASGANAVAIGTQAEATASNSIALGFDAVASAALAFAASDGTASGVSSIAIGESAVAGTASSTIAIGRNTDATGTDALAIGSNAQSTGSKSIAIGQSLASGTNSFASNCNNNTSSYGASGTGCIAIGSVAKAAGNSSNIAIGSNATVTAYDYGIAIGDADVTGRYGIGMGRYSNVGGERAVNINGGQYSTSNYSVSIGFSSSGNQRSQTTGVGALSLMGSNATGQNSFAAMIGSTNNNNSHGAFAQNAIAIGDSARASQLNSVALGASATSEQIGKFAFSAGKFAADGDAQGGQFILRADTTDATATVLTTNNAAAAATNQIVAASDTCITFDGTITAMQNGAQAYASWRIEGLLVNDGGTTTLANSATTVISNSSGWGMALSADNTNNALSITVTGEAAHNIRWVANIRTTEVTYA